MSSINAIKLFALAYFLYDMLAIAGETAEPNWLTFFEDTHGYPVSQT